MTIDIFKIIKKKSDPFSIDILKIEKKNIIIDIEKFYVQKSKFEKLQSILFLKINGLSENLINYYKKEIIHNNYILTLDTRGIHLPTVIEQLYFSKKIKKKAVLVDKLEVAMIAIIQKCDYLICSNLSSSDIERIRSFADFRIEKNEKILTINEIDSYEMSMLSIVAKKNLSKNKLITEKDLKYLNVRPSGIGPHLIDKIVGLRLKYSIKKNKRITFGDFYET